MHKLKPISRNPPSRFTLVKFHINPKFRTLSHPVAVPVLHNSIFKLKTFWLVHATSQTLHYRQLQMSRIFTRILWPHSILFIDSFSSVSIRTPTPYVCPHWICHSNQEDQDETNPPQAAPATAPQPTEEAQLMIKVMWSSSQIFLAKSSFATRMLLTDLTLASFELSYYGAS